MFTGIIEAMGTVVSTEKQGSNLLIVMKAPFVGELKVDQSVSHNGVCLTVTGIVNGNYSITAIDETLKRSNLSQLQPGDAINLERCMKANGRFDGHIVQGHVDCMATCTNVSDKNGSYLFSFKHEEGDNFITVEKGSVCVNGVSLTVVDSTKNSFSVAIIPYTYEHTNFRFLKEGSVVNVEFDIIGKYIKRITRLAD